MDVNTIVTTVISIFVPVITSALTIIVKHWVDEKVKDMKDKKLQSLIQEGTDIIFRSVDRVQQTYVDEIKKGNFFDEGEQIKAFEKARDNAMELLPQEICTAIGARYGDVDNFVETMIESYIARKKEL